MDTSTEPGHADAAHAAAATAPSDARSDTPSDAPSTAPWLLMRFSTQMHAVSNRFAVRHDLHPTDVTAMAVLAAAQRPLTAGALSAQLELSTGATTRLIDRLERSGHLAQETDPHDARRRLVSITDEARATAGAHFGQLGARVEEVLAGFAPAEREVIDRFLDHLVTTMDQLPDEA